MRFTLLSHGVPVGTSDLDTFDASVGAARGTFHAGPDWVGVAAAAPPVRTRAPWARVLAQLAARRAALGLMLADAAGRPVATAALEVEDAGDEGGGPQLVAYLARPEQWLAEYGAPYVVESGE